MASRRKVLAVGAAGCLALPVLGLVGLVVLYKGFDYVGSAQGVESIRAQLAEIKRGEMDKAYRRMGGSWRAMNDPEDFEAFVAKHPALRANRDATFPHRSANNEVGTAVLENAVLTSTTGVREVFTFRISSTGGIFIEPIEPAKP